MGFVRGFTTELGRKVAGCIIKLVIIIVILFLIIYISYIFYLSLIR